MIRIMLLFSFFASLFSCNTTPGYQIKNGAAYLETPGFKDFSYRKNLKKLDAADVKTFQVLKDGCYAKDDSRVFYQEKLIRGADAVTFEVLGEQMGRDTNHGYFMGSQLLGSDGKTFRKLTKVYARDQHSVYYGKERINGAKTGSFEIADEKLALSRDGSSYFKRATKLPVKDYKMFIQLSGEFWKDKYQVYYISNPVNPDRVILKGVDAESSKSVNGVTIRDKYGCHNGYERVPCQ